MQQNSGILRTVKYENRSYEEVKMPHLFNGKCWCTPVTIVIEIRADGEAVEIAHWFRPFYYPDFSSLIKVERVS